jgi:hypothetical protein
VVSTTPGNRTTTYGVAVKDTFVYVPSFYDTLWIYSVADPAAPYPIAGAPLGADNRGRDAAMFNDTLVSVGCEHNVVFVNVSDPAHPRVVGSSPSPGRVRRVVCSPPYLYACCGGAGVAIYETTQVAVAEPWQDEVKQARKGASVVRGVLNLEVGSRQNTAFSAELLDVSGRKVLDLHPGANDVRALAPGVYFVREAQAQAQAQAVRKVVKLK